MSLLVSLSITSGLFIFFNRIKNDLTSFWILGSSKKKLHKSFVFFIHFLSIISVIMGIFVGLFFLFLMDKYAPEILPDLFIDRKIPIHVTVSALGISFIVDHSDLLNTNKYTPEIVRNNGNNIAKIVSGIIGLRKYKAIPTRIIPKIILTPTIQSPAFGKFVILLLKNAKNTSN